MKTKRLCALIIPALLLAGCNNFISDLMIPITVDLEPDGIIVVFSGGGDFLTAASGYQSVVTMTVKRRTGGVVEALGGDETVSWAVTSEIDGSKLYIDPTNGVWKRTASALNGLTWGNSAHTGTTGGNGYDQSDNSWNQDAIMGTPPGTAQTASLTDVVGSRTITVTASASGGGTAIASSFTFGKGPLSLFSKTWANGGSGVKWSNNYTDDNISGFQNGGNSFPAAETFCGGTVNRNVSTNSTASDAYFTPDSGGWSVPHTLTGVNQVYARYAQGSRLPQLEQLRAVAAYSGTYTNTPERKGAALAAGWSLGSYNYAWTGEVCFGTYTFRAVYVCLDNGNSVWAGVNDSGPAAVCLK